jgi:uncharacterized membrane protein
MIVIAVIVAAIAVAVSRIAVVTVTGNQVRNYHFIPLSLTFNRKKTKRQKEI